MPCRNAMLKRTSQEVIWPHSLALWSFIVRQNSFSYWTIVSNHPESWVTMWREWRPGEGAGKRDSWGWAFGIGAKVRKLFMFPRDLACAWNKGVLERGSQIDIKPICSLNHLTYQTRCVDVQILYLGLIPVSKGSSYRIVYHVNIQSTSQ